jgi:hypothetical protein
VFFRQVIGRVNRTRFQENKTNVTQEAASLDLECFVYLPSDPKLIGHAKNIEDDKRCALAEIVEKEKREQLDPRQGNLSLSTFLNSQHNGLELVVSVGGIEYRGDDAKKYEKLLLIGLSADMAQKAMCILYDNKENNVKQEYSEITLDDEIKKLRVQCHKLAFYLSKIKGCEVREIHNKYPNHETMSKDQLTQKLYDLKRQIGSK